MADLSNHVTGRAYDTECEGCGGIVHHVIGGASTHVGVEPGDLPLASVRAAYGGAHCRRCGKAVTWLETAEGRHLAVDPAPTADGRVEVLRAAGKLVAVQHGKPPPDGHTRYRVHVAGCTPRVRGWRGRR